MASPDTTPSTSKYKEEYDAIKSGIEKQIEEARKNVDYNNMFSSEYDRIKADTNKDGKISKDEFGQYVGIKQETKTEKPIDATLKMYAFDSSIVLSIGIVCITAIFISIISKWMR